VYAPGPWNCALPAARCRDVLRLGVGPLLQRLLANMERAGGAGASPGAGASAPPPANASAGAAVGGGGGGSGGSVSADARLPRLFLWSGHDSTVHALLAALGQETHTWAPFTANLIFELWEAPSGARSGSSGEGPASSGAPSSGNGGGGSGGGGGGGGGSDNSGGAAEGAWWVRVLYNGRPLPALGGRGRSALLPREQEERPFPGAPPQGPREPEVAEWRRARQLETGQAPEAGGGGGGGGQGSGWIRLAALRERLKPVTATDEEKAAACWPGQSLD
jgi:hypothetical protein